MATNTNMNTNTIESTLVAAFRSDSKAQAAVQELEHRGVQHDHIHVHDGGSEAGARETTQGDSLVG